MPGKVHGGRPGNTRTIAVIGAGGLGRYIAQAAALGGYPTILEDLLPNALRQAETKIRARLDDAVILGTITEDAASAAHSRLTYADSIDQAARAADLVIEAVPEELESKIEIFTMLDKICRPTTILVSSTSTLSVSEISRVTYRANRCAGMRFPDFPKDVTAVEIVRTPETNDETLATVTELGKSMAAEIRVLEVRVLEER